MWCVVECSCDGGIIFSPDFFDTEKDAIEFIKNDANKFYGNVCDFPEANIYIENDGLSATVSTDEYSWVWQAFDISNKI